MKFNSNSTGIVGFLKALKQIENQFNITRSNFLIFLEPTGGNYSYLVQQVLLNEEYQLFQVESKAFGELRNNNLSISEKSDLMAAKVMSYMGWHKQLPLTCKELL